MKTILKRLCAAALLLALFASLAACSAPSSSAQNASQSGAASTGSAAGGTTAGGTGTSGETPAMVFQATYAALPEGIDYLNRPQVYDGRIWSLTSIYEEEGDAYLSAAVSFLPDGTDLRQLVLPAEAGVSYNTLLPLSDGGFWTAVTVYEVKADGEYNYDRMSYELRRFDADGTQTASVDLSFAAENSEWFYVDRFLADADGRLYLICNDNVHVLDPDGAPLFSLSCNHVSSAAVTADGRVLLGYYGGRGSYVLSEVDIDARDFGKTYELPGNSNLNGLAGGTDGYLFYVTSDDAFCGYNAETQSYDELFRFLRLDLNSDGLDSVLPLGNRTFLTVCYEDGGTLLCTIREAPASAQKTTLTLACLYTNYELKSQIIRFNKTNPDYRIDILDYSQYNTDGDYEAGLSKLSADITAGNVPDLIELSQLPVATYAARGILAELGPLLDADTELTRDDLLPGALQALSVDGKLWSLAPQMTLMTLYGLRPVLGDRESITAQDIAALVREHPGVMPVANGTQESLLLILTMFTLDEFIDTETGECRFDSDEFRALLGIAAAAPAELDYENYIDDDTRLQEGSALLATLPLSEVTDLQRLNVTMKGQYAITGFPTQSGSGTVASFETQLGISAQSAHIDGAWAFLRSLLTEDSGYHSWGIPVNRARYEAMLEDAAEAHYYTDENGRQVESPKMTMSTNGGPEIDIYAATEEEIAAFRALVDSVDRTYTYDEKLMGIITEEAGAFFAGQKSAADVSAVIQSRAKIYIAESR